MRKPAASMAIDTASAAGCATRQRTAPAASTTNIALTHAGPATPVSGAGAIRTQAQITLTLLTQTPAAGSKSCARFQLSRPGSSSASGLRKASRTPPSAAKLASIKARRTSSTAIAAANQK